MRLLGDKTKLTSVSNLKIQYFPIPHNSHTLSFLRRKIRIYIILIYILSQLYHIYDDISKFTKHVYTLISLTFVWNNLMWMHEFWVTKHPSFKLHIQSLILVMVSCGSTILKAVVLVLVHWRWWSVIWVRVVVAVRWRFGFDITPWFLRLSRTRIFVSVST